MSSSEVQTAAWKIFHYRYEIVLARIHTLTDAQIEWGVLTTGNRQLDEESMDEPIMTMRTIAEMAQLAKEGISFRLGNYKDSTLIVKIIEEHFDDWVTRLDNPNQVMQETEEDRNRMLRVLEDIEDLETLSELLLPISERSDNPVSKNKLVGRMQKLGFMMSGKENIITKDKQPQKKERFYNRLSEHTVSRISKW